MSRMLDCDVIIIGGGIVGSAAALALAERGRRVVLLERDTCGSRSSGVNYGGVRRQGRKPCQLPLSQRAHAIWAGLKQRIGIDGEYVRCGHLKLARNAEDMAALEQYFDLTRDAGLGLRLLDAKVLRRDYPWLGERAVGASLCPEDGQANPRLVSPAFAWAAARAGAQIFEHTLAEKIERLPRGFEVACKTLLALGGLVVRGEQLINCAGAWAGPFAAQFGEPVPLAAGHPAMAVTEPLPFFMPLSLGVEGGSIYGRQVQRGNFVIGGGPGLALDGERARNTTEALLPLFSQALELLPALRNAQVIRSWSGTEANMPDRQPVLCASRTTPGLWHGFGFSGAGFQIGPAAGEVLAELACDGRTSTPIEAFAIERFAAPLHPGTPGRDGPRFASPIA